jgi:hypothetical protein
MGHCKHQWQERTDVLREVFNGSERRKHAFYVCGRCLKIDEVLSPPVSLERPAAMPRVAEPKRDAA